MEQLAVNEFRRQVGEYINQAHYARKGFVLTKGEKKMAALVPLSVLERLAELEKLLAHSPAGQTTDESTTSEMP